MTPPLPIVSLPPSRLARFPRHPSPRSLMAKHRLWRPFLFLVVVCGVVSGPRATLAEVSRPNVVFILADDLGYGDVKCFGGDRCKIATPAFDRLAREGMRFTDAHANASVCVPTRVAIMTGRYPWRFGRPGPGGPWGFLGPRFPIGTHTLGTMMKSAGYRTGYVGKWHLGTTMQTIDGKTQGPSNVDYSKPLTHGPAQFGFDQSFILPGSLDMYPYVFARNNRWVGEVTAEKGWSAFNRLGPAAADFEDTKVLSTFSSEAERFVADAAGDAKNGSPFFLYVALTAPHTPTSPSADFAGQSDIGIYGDFVMETDHCVRRVMDALRKHGLENDTLVIATSDHGPAPYAGRQKPATYLQLKELEKEGHFSGGPFRGYKFSVFEGGFRVPFVARWPDVIPGGTTCGRLIGLQDLMATLADIAQVKLEDHQAPDSFSMLPLMKDPEAPATRESMVLEATRARAVRTERWKLALCPGSGSEGRWGNSPKHSDAWRQAIEAAGRPESRAGLLAPQFVQLYDLQKDPGETENLAATNMDKVREMHAILRRTIDRGRSTPGAPLKGDALNNGSAAVRAFPSVPPFVWQKPLANDTTLRCTENARQIQISIGGKPVVTYQKSIRESPDGIAPVFRRSGYLHPVMTPSGRTVTGDFPPDHAHQHAIFSAYVRTRFEGNAVDFWNQRAEQGGVRHDRVISTQQSRDSASFQVRLAHEQYVGDGKTIPALYETWKVTVHRTSANAYLFDLESEQTCASDSPLTIRKYHYGGMALRGSNQWYSESTAAALTAAQQRLKKNPDAELPSLELAGHRFLTDEGKNRFSGNHSRANWVSISGVVDGEPAGIVVIGHPDNFRHPQPVRLHPNKPYFCFAPMVLGEFTIRPGQPFRSKYRYIVHDGPPDIELIRSTRREFR